MPRIFSRTGGHPRRTGRPVRVAAPATPDGGVVRARSQHSAIKARTSVLLLLLALTLTACGGGGGSGGAQSADSSAGYAPQDEGVAAPPGASGEGAAASAGAASSSAAQEEDVGVGSAEGARAALPGFDGEKIVKTAELAVRARDVRESASRAQEIAARFGGSVSSSRIDEGDGSVSADLVLSVPSGEFEATLGELRDLGDATTDTVGGEDVTEEFVDLESRERNLLRAEESLLRLYDEAESVDDALSIERELTGLREQIELVQGRIQFLGDRTATSRISLGIRPVENPAESRPAWDPARAVSTAWNASLGFLGTVAGAALSVVVFGWWLAPVLVGATLWWRRRARDANTAAGP